MKRFVLLSLAATAALNALTTGGSTSTGPMIPSSMSTDRGGTKTAIDAYTDGGGVEVFSNKIDNAIDNSAMNDLVFKYGEQAKENGVTIQDQVKSIDSTVSTDKEKALADKLGASNVSLNTSPQTVPADGTSCDDKNTLTKNDVWTNGVCAGILPTGPCDDTNVNTVNDVFVNGVCTGKLVATPTCSDNTYTFNATSNSCEKTVSSSYAATAQLAGYTISSTSFSTGNTGIEKGTNSFRPVINASNVGAWVYIKPDGTLSGITSATNGASYFGLKNVGAGFAAFNSSTGNTGTTIQMSGTGISASSTEVSYSTTYSMGLIKTSATTFRFRYIVAGSTTYDGPDISFVPFYSGTYTCPNGGTLSGSNCVTSSVSTTAPICQTGYTMDNTLYKCVQN